MNTAPAWLNLQVSGCSMLIQNDSGDAPIYIGYADPLKITVNQETEPYYLLQKLTRDVPGGAVTSISFTRNRNKEVTFEAAWTDRAAAIYS